MLYLLFCKLRKIFNDTFIFNAGLFPVMGAKLSVLKRLCFRLKGGM